LFCFSVAITDLSANTAIKFKFRTFLPCNETDEKCIISLCYKLSYLKIENLVLSRYLPLQKNRTNYSKSQQTTEAEVGGAFCIFTVKCNLVDVLVCEPEPLNTGTLGTRLNFCMRVYSDTSGNKISVDPDTISEKNISMFITSCLEVFL
jgi:hypothetical protein